MKTFHSHTPSLRHIFFLLFTSFSLSQKALDIHARTISSFLFNMCLIRYDGSKEMKILIPEYFASDENYQKILRLDFFYVSTFFNFARVKKTKALVSQPWNILDDYF